jgi:hypothetical protein
MYNGIADLEKIGLGNCDQATKQLAIFLKNNENEKEIEMGLQASQNIAETRTAISGFGDRLRSNLIQFAAMCRDSSLDEAAADYIKKRQEMVE